MKNLGIGLVIGASLASSVGGTFKSLDKSIGQLQAKAKDVKLGIAAGEKWKDLRGEALKLSSALQAGKLDTAGIARFNQLKAATKEAEAEAKKYGFTLGGLNKQLGTMQRFSAVQNGFLRRAEARDARKQERGELRGRLAGTVAVGTAMFAYPLKAAMDFEQGMAEVGAITRADDADMARLTENAREMGRTTKFSATQAAQGQKFLAMAGFKTNQIISSMPGMLDLAAASGMDLGRTADIASNILTGFGMEASDMTRVANVMALAFSSSNTDVEQLGYAMKYAAPQAKALGFSIEQTAAIVSKLSDAGIQGQMAGTTLRGMIDSLTDKGNAKKLKALKVDVVDKKGNLRDLGTIIKEMDKRMSAKGWGSAKRASFIKDVFGARAGTGANAIWDAVLSGSLEELTQKYINEQDGAVRRMADKINATAKGSLTQLGSALESVGIDLGNVLLPPLAETAKGLASIVSSVSQFMQKCPVLTKWVVGLGAGFLGLKAATLATRIGWSHLRDGGSIALDILQRVRPSVIANSLAMARMRGEGSALKGMFTVLKGGIGSFVSGASADLKALGGAVKWLWGLCAAHPFIAIGTAVAAVAIAVYTYWEPLKEWLGAFWEGIKGYWGKSVEWIKTSVSGLGDAIKYPFEVAFGWIESTIGKIQGAWNSFMSLFGMGVEEINTTPISITTDLGSAAAPGISLGGLQGGDIVGHASGGLINRPVVSWVGEDGPEVVVPVGSKHRQQGLFWLGKAASALGMSLSEKGDGASASWADRLREFSAAVMAAPQPALAGAGGMTNNFTINPAPGMDEQGVADLIIRKLEDWQRGQATKQRSSYRDDAFLG
ncbi:phage tail tape measure protein [Fretibacterium fastidiosum]|uniref:Phage tail tape measure protein, TP901 family, core region n=1 Tax=Fretibacterium fastidiosum TaxID=651822 RepID=A0AB94IXV4_9BACT|nr:phage tail tape measure protein [Fretibacterium fastidiosum]CBL28568.1 phage tail tape measure protein, TP901 family, core region [Fretibacterium fastidiosum]